MSTQTNQLNANTQEGSPFKVSLFAPGMTALTTTVLLKLMEDLMQIANSYDLQFCKQVQAQSAVATSLGNFQEELGESEMADYIGQAVTSGLGGLASIGMSVSGSFGNEELNSTQKELDETQANQEKLKNAPAPNPNINENGTEEESSEELMTEQEKQEQIDTNNEKIETLSKKLERLKGEVQAKMQKRATFGQAAQSIFSSGGNLNTAIQKEKQGKQNKNVTESQAALQGMQQISSQSLQNGNKYLQQSEAITELLKAISQANKVANS